MDKSHFINLTLGVYRVTDLFPNKEPLRFSLRKKADDILRDLTLTDYYLKDSLSDNKQALNSTLERVLRNVAVLGVYFNISEKQNWVKPENFLVLRAEYGAIDQEAKRLRLEAVKHSGAVRPSENKEKPKSARSEAVSGNHSAMAGLKSRQQKILRILKERGNSQVQDLNKALPEVTKRTLRRDMDFLLKRGLVARLGDKIRTEYRLKV
ncbi:MAG: DeoR family transcriptional regulator [Candidatus Pacebacteria bacterium]|nr:DeoR family transcriptional regulator [Candidatus Paceibacterota bacterium]